MTSKSPPGSFDGFIRWIAKKERAGPAASVVPSRAVLEAARVAHREFQAVTQESLRRGRGYSEQLQLMAAADVAQNRRVSRLRTPNGFVISPLYSKLEGTDAVGLLLECPESLVETFRGKVARIFSAGQWVEIGVIDAAGKAVGDWPAGLQFKPPFELRIGQFEEMPVEPSDPEPS